MSSQCASNIHKTGIKIQLCYLVLLKAKYISLIDVNLSMMNIYDEYILSQNIANCCNFHEIKN